MADGEGESEAFVSRRIGFAGVVLGAIVSIVAPGHVPAQGVTVRVPRGPREVYVPVDPLAPPISSGPVVPAVPAVPGVELTVHVFVLPA